MGRPDLSPVGPLAPLLLALRFRLRYSLVRRLSTRWVVNRREEGGNALLVGCIRSG
jgi:hypothetical protein